MKALHAAAEVGRKRWGLVLLALAAGYGCYVLLRPYLAPIVIAALLAILFQPLHRLVCRYVRSGNGSALIATAVALLLTLGVVVGGGVLVGHDLRDLYLDFQAGDHSRPLSGALESAQRILDQVASRIGVEPDSFHKAVTQRMEQLTNAGLQLTATAARNTLGFVVNGAITVFLLFFAFRDGKKAVATLARFAPLPPRDFQHLLRRANQTIVATFYGALAVAFAQGCLTAAALWALGVRAPVVWGLVTGMFSVVPYVGSAAVWIPICIVLAISGAWGKSLVLLAWGSLVVGLVDNVIRPWIVSREAALHPVVVFFSLLGGVRAFGLVGIFVGPVIAATALGLFAIVRQEFAVTPLAPELSKRAVG